MGDIEKIIINDQYAILLGITILFTLLAIYRRTPLADLIAWVCWFVCATCHLLASPLNSPLLPVAFIYVAFGFVFLILSIADTGAYLDYRKAQKGAVI